MYRILSSTTSEDEKMMVRIVLADDHPIVREGLRAVLETQSDFEVVAEVENGREAVSAVTRLQPDILLLDLEMPTLDGVETTRTLHIAFVAHELSGLPRIIVFTAFDNDERIIHAIQAGADGYLLKGAPREDIFRAIRIALEGGSLLQPLVASKLMQHIGQPVETLTERELEVLHLLARGMPNKEIAHALVISERTAKFHVSSIMGKLGATNRTEAVSLAAQKGIIVLHS
jgi:DNA-binding NarL/FixJ family response regulator